MDDLDLALEAANAGAQIVAADFGRSRTANYKAEFDPVTVTDRHSEETIVRLIAANRPADHILAEEGGGTPERGGSPAGRRWIVDPLDGTVNFVHGIPQVSVSVALWEGDEPIVGVVHDPLRNEVFSAVAGEGAALNGDPIRVSQTEHLDRAVVATGFPYDHGRYAAEYTAALTAVLEKVNGIRRIGSAALDLAWVAAGRFEGYWELSLKPWDQAAGIVLIQEAGGCVTDANGTPSVPSTPLVVAGNASIHEQLRVIVEAHLPDRLRPERP